MALRDPERERDLWQHQWCQLHLDVCENVDVLRRGRGLGSVLLLVCAKCISALRKAGALVPTRWAGQECWGIVASRREGVERVPYLVELKQIDVILLRALGYTVQEVDSGDDAEVERGNDL